MSFGWLLNTVCSPCRSTLQLSMGFTKTVTICSKFSPWLGKTRGQSTHSKVPHSKFKQNQNFRKCEQRFPNYLDQNPFVLMLSTLACLFWKCNVAKQNNFKVSSSFSLIIPHKKIRLANEVLGIFFPIEMQIRNNKKKKLLKILLQ